MKALFFLIWLLLIALLVCGICLVVNGHTLWGWILIIIAVFSRVTYRE